MHKATQSNKVSGPTKSVAVAYTKPTKSTKPRISTSNKQQRQTTVVIHREFLTDIQASTEFAVTAYPVNPGLSKTFPWLAAMAQLFETYRFRKLAFCYEPTCGSLTTGAVSAAIDFDASDDPPQTKAQLMSYHNAVRVSPWSTIRYQASTFDMSKFASSRYVRTKEQPSGTDIKTYDVGNFFLAVSGSDSSPPFIGELYVEYEVELFTPQIPSTPGTANYSNAVESIDSNGGAVTNSAPLGPNPRVLLPTVPGGIPIQPLTINAGGLQFDVPGRYLLEWSLDLISSEITSANIDSPDPGLAFTQVGDVNRSDNIWIVVVPTSGLSFDLKLATNKEPKSSIIRVATYPQPLV